MKPISVSREYGAGDGEVARRLASVPGWELLHRAAQLEHLPDSELEAVDEQAINLADRFRLHPPRQRYIHGLANSAHRAVEKGNAVLAGHGSRQLVGEIPKAFHLRLVAPRDWWVRRMATIENAIVRFAESEQVSLVVAGHHGHSRIARFFLGSTSDRVSGHCQCSVLIIK
jgi:nucleotide-binding universal stress UspA family protein